MRRFVLSIVKPFRSVPHKSKRILEKYFIFFITNLFIKKYQPKHSYNNVGILSVKS